MTSDAKIGLLLGLVFIFVIAFIINGLPNFGARAQNADAAPVTNFGNDTLGVADQAQNAQERLDWAALLEQGGVAETVVAQEPPTVAEELVLPEPSATVFPDTAEVRRIFTLDNLVGGVSQTIEDIRRQLTEASEAVPMQKQTQERMPPLDLPKPQPAGTTRTQAPAQAPAQTPATAKNPAPRQLLMRTYIVQEGDVLATIAKKVYGPVEGNRLVNVRRIYSANALVLNSPDEIFVGQKLLIPPLPEAKEGTDKPNPTLAEGMFEKAESIGARNLADIKTPKPEGRWYVVQDGDNLWKIAASQLGSGARCDEIAKMNTDILKSKDVLDIGMRLRLPSK
jgi:nucleoid-associated protein YgaU